MNLEPLKKEMEKHLGDHTLNVFESEGLYLFNLANKYALDLVNHFGNIIHQILRENELILENKEFQVIQKILIQSQIIKSRLEKADIALKKALEKVRKSNKVNLLTEEELMEASKIILNTQTCPHDFVMEAEPIYQSLIQTYCTNAAIKSGLFSSGEIISIDQLNLQSPRVALHAKKTAFDQMCLLIFGNINHDYDLLRKIEEIDENHKINDFLDYKVKNAQILFAYIELEPLSTPKFPRFASILSAKKGIACTVEDVLHNYKILKVECNIAGNNVFVEVPVYYGLIITKVDTNNNKPLELNEILNSSLNNKPEIENPRYVQNIASSYLSAFEKLATSTHESYNKVVRELKTRGSLNGKPS